MIEFIDIENDSYLNINGEINFYISKNISLTQGHLRKTFTLKSNDKYFIEWFEITDKSIHTLSNYKRNIYLIKLGDCYSIYGAYINEYKKNELFNYTLSFDYFDIEKNTPLSLLSYIRDRKITNILS